MTTAAATLPSVSRLRSLTPAVLRTGLGSTGNSLVIQSQSGILRRNQRRRSISPRRCKRWFYLWRSPGRAAYDVGHCLVRQITLQRESDRIAKALSEYEESLAKHTAPRKEVGPADSRILQ